MPQLEKRDFSTAEREKLAGTGAAMDDGSFPIKSAEDLKNAIHLVGKGKNPAAAKAHIIRRAKALGLTGSLPDGWSVKKSVDNDEMFVEGEIVKSDKQVDRDGREYRLVVSAVMIPRPRENPDLQKDWTDEQEIEDACHEFMIHLQKSEDEADKEPGESGLSYRHTRMISSNDARIVENWKLRKSEEWNGKTYPVGTWMIAARVYKASLFKEIDSGDLKGCSVEGSAFYRTEE